MCGVYTYGAMLYYIYCTMYYTYCMVEIHVLAGILRDFAQHGMIKH